MTLSVRLRHRYPGLALDIAFDAPQGLTVLFGRSGAGKSTIVNAVAGLARPQSARIEISGRVLTDTENGKHLPPHRRRLGYIFQDARLFPHLSVDQNLRYGRRFSPRAATLPEPDRIISMLGLEDLLHRRPDGLSGGERQRVAIGRALLAGPELILADEPLAALDDARKAEILPYFERLRDEVEVPILYVTHSAAEVARLATTVVAVEAGQVVRQGPAFDVLSDPMVTPTGARAAGAVLTATVMAHHADGLTELAAGDGRLLVPRIAQDIGHSVRVRIGAQEVILARNAPEGLSALNILPGRVVSIRSGDGPGVLVSLATPAGQILARITRRSCETLGLAPGLTCHAIVKSVAIGHDDITGARR